MAKTLFKNRIEGNELDLSMNDLIEVPVQDLANVPKATHLDLSNNKIKSLPINFASLTHLVKIDLSSNALIELPYNFGNLVNLYSLDLYANQIKELPLSFCRLKHLKWLDLKNNPLEPQLKIVAGDCLDEKQCKECAKKVVAFMQSIQSELERQKQKKLKEERMKLAERMAKEAEELEEQRRLKKAERERRKAEALAKSFENKKAHSSNESSTKCQNEENTGEQHQMSNSKEGSCWSSLLYSFLLIFLSVCAVIVFFTFDKMHRIQSTDDLVMVVQESALEVKDTVQIWWKVFALPYLEYLNERLQNLTESLTK